MTRAASARFLALPLLIASLISLVPSPARSAPLADCPPGLLLLAQGPSPQPRPTRGSGSSDFIDLPDQPTSPPQLGHEENIVPIGCKRSFKVGDKVYSLDSHHRQDAENLRPHLDGVEGALEELNEYQRNLRKARIAAYTGTLGVAVALASVLLLEQNNPDRKIGVFGGLGILGASLGYSLAVTQSNENHITEAVKIYNEERPERRIELFLKSEF